MIESFFVWLLGPNLCVMFLLVGSALLIFSVWAVVINAEEILEYLDNRRKEK